MTDRGASLSAHDFLHGGSIGLLVFAAWQHLWWLVIISSLVAITTDVGRTR